MKTNFIRKIMTNEITSSKGSAILISMLITAVLLVLGLSLNQLIIKEMAIERGLISAGKAYYAAEAAIEDALYEMNSHTPGYQAEEHPHLDGDGYVRQVLPGGATQFEYKILARGSEIPCAYAKISDEIALPQGSSGPRWQILNVQESLRLPLYRYDKDDPKKYRDFANFKVAYYMPYTTAFSTWGQTPEDVGDVLRWKILGITPTSQKKTQAISDFIPIFDINHNVVDNPSSFGTESELINMGKYYVDVDAGFEFEEGFLIGTFINPNDAMGHTLNYLILTNAVEWEDQISLDGNNTPEANTIYFRITSSSDEFVCEKAKITSRGIAGNFEQNVSVEIKLDTFLPVFDFALYRTVEDLTVPVVTDWRRMKVVDP